jgi:hypothetical protein
MTHATAEPALVTVEQSIAARGSSALPMTITGIETVALRIPYSDASTELEPDLLQTHA